MKIKFLLQKELIIQKIFGKCLKEVLMKDEDYYEAALRELKEETSIKSVELN